MTPHIRKLRGGIFPKYILEKDFRFSFTHDGKYVFFYIPSGFKYDGATMGSFIFWRKSLHESKYTIAHDWMYERLGDVNARYLNGYKFGEISKKLSDDIFLQGIRREVNVQNWRAAIASFALKTIGWIFWKRREWLG